MLRTPVLLAVWLLGTLLSAQDDGLSGDFGRLSAKERTRIARQEADESARDGAFQAIMAQAEELFRAQRYAEALERYQDARRLRPYNVYPPVKIQDLQALLARRDAERAASNAAEVPAAASTSVSVPDPAMAVMEAGPAPVIIPVEPSMTVTGGSHPVEKKAPPQSVPSSANSRQAPRQAPSRDASTGASQERMYREGRSIVLERWRSEQGRAVEYRRVAHPWGEVVHFRDGQVISERTWEEMDLDHTATSRTGISSSER